MDPDVVLLPAGRFRIFFKDASFAFDPALPTPANPQPTIRSAVSVDGLLFTVEGPAINVLNAADPTVVQTPGGTWLMAFDLAGNTYLASSVDGQLFEPNGIQFDFGVPELAVLPDNRLLLVPSGGGARVYLSEDDGSSWTSQTSSIDELGFNPTIVRTAKEYLLLYNRYSNN